MLDSQVVRSGSHGLDRPPLQFLWRDSSVCVGDVPMVSEGIVEHRDPIAG
jgi:hypothetical protein